MQSFVALHQQLTASYILDCVVLAIFAALGVALNFVTPHKKVFSVNDVTIAYPNYPDTVSTPVLFVIAVILPALVIAPISIAFVSAHSIGAKNASDPRVMRRRLWELFTGLLGLAFAVILAFFLTQAMKNFFGKPRPDFLARCRPDMSTYGEHIVSSFTNAALEGNSILVRSEICKAYHMSGKDVTALTDGFRSFPSGHCSVGFAGLVYLSLYLAGKFSIAIPVLSFNNQAPTENATRVQMPHSQLQARDDTAGPPLFLFVLVFFPVGVAFYIASSRYMDYKHHGFDVLFSSLAGTLCAWFGFRWYQVPIGRGAGWSWGPRSDEAAFGIKVGVSNYHVKGGKKARNAGKPAAKAPIKGRISPPKQRPNFGMGRQGTHDVELGHIQQRNNTPDSGASSRTRVPPQYAIPRIPSDFHARGDSARVPSGWMG